MRVLWCVLACILGVSVASGHPQDGPDVDARTQIKDHAITMSLAFNLAFLDEYGLAPRETASDLHPIEAEALRDNLFEFLSERNSVIVDGVRVQPVLREFEIPQTDDSLLPLFPNFGMRALRRARVVVDYPLLNEPSKVTIAWGAFPHDYVLSTPDDQRTIVVVMQMWAGGVSWVHDLSEASPSYTWLAGDASAQGRLLEVPAVPTKVDSHLMIPALSLSLIGAWVVLTVGILLTRRTGPRWTIALSLLPIFLVGAWVSRDSAAIEGPVVTTTWPLLDDDEIDAIFVPLHTNIYRSFDYTEEEKVYDALAQSAAGDLLDELYEEIYNDLEMQLEDGAAVSRVQSVDHLDIQLDAWNAPDDDTMTFAVTTTWQVTGAVFHWGHSHTRTNEYKARYTIAGTPEGWRIVDTELLEQARIDAVPGDPNGVFRPGMDL